jgi:hypothetical protein
MQNKIYKCCWCKQTVNYHPNRFDRMKYEGPYRSYDCKAHYDFCDSCYGKIKKFIVDNKLKGYAKIPKSD